MPITKVQFSTLSDLFDYYNEELFNGQLTECLVNMSRHKGAHGFYAPNSWRDERKKTVHEISLNPESMSRTDKEWQATLVHEMVHHWQHTLGNPSRKAYHDKEWGNKMEEIGLMPSDTGQVGGKRTGQSMTHYVIENGAFEKAFSKITKEANEKLRLKYLPNKGKHFVGSEGLEEGEEGEEGEEKKPSKNQMKMKYTCSCGCNIWGKTELDITCNLCESKFEMVEK